MKQNLYLSLIVFTLLTFCHVKGMAEESKRRDPTEQPLREIEPKEQRQLPQRQEQKPSKPSFQQKSDRLPSIDRLPSNDTQKKSSKNPKEETIQKKNSSNKSRIEAQRYLQSAKKPNVDKKLSAQKEQEIRKKLQEKRANDKEVTKKVRGWVAKEHSNYIHWFNNQFFQRHRYYPEYYFPGNYVWRGVGWNTVALWLGWGWNRPLFYYQDYPLDQPADFDDYSRRNYPPPVNFRGDWLPIGVFAISMDPSKVFLSDRFIQLAISKEGSLGGVFYNSTTDQTYPLTGIVDRATQQAAWKSSENPNSPWITTGLYDLTQDVVPIQVHFQNKPEQSWNLVRLNPNP